MEDTLRDVRKDLNELNKFGLNPCFNGRYSQSWTDFSIAENFGVS